MTVKEWNEPDFIFLTYESSIRAGSFRPTVAKLTKKGVFSANMYLFLIRIEGLTLDNQTVYGIYLAYIEDYLQELGEDSRRIFRAAGLHDSLTLQQGQRVDVQSLASLMLAVNRFARRSSFFLELGARIPIMAHGNLGSAIMACKDVGTVFGLIERYAAIALPFVRIVLTTDKEHVYVEYQVSTPWPELNIAILEAFIGTTGYNISLLTSTPFYPKRVEVSFKAPPHAEGYAAYTHCPVTFSAPVNRLTFTRAQFDLPLKTANSLNQRVMVQQCEHELKKVQSHTRVSERVRDIISLHLETAPSIQFVAEKLHTSERTLRRRLEEENVNFRDLLRQIRYECACYYLQETDLRIEQIAVKLGYTETANFRKAFKDDTGVSPRQWRDQHRSKNS